MLEKVKDFEKDVEKEVEKGVDTIAEKTHMKPWMVLSIIGVIILVIIGLIGWCIWRFFKKKRPKGAEAGDKQDDENALVDNEEANVEEVSVNIWSKLFLPSHIYQEITLALKKLIIHMAFY